MANKVPSRRCLEVDCQRTAVSRGLCNPCYQQRYHKGIPLPPKTERTSPEVRFWLQVDKAGPTMPHMESECWIWTAASHNGGYGTFGVNGKVVLAHRFVRPDIRPGYMACHRCDNRACVRPDHLYEGTAKQNSDDRWARRPNLGTLRAEAHPSAKLTADIVRECRRVIVEKDRKYGYTALARRYGVTPRAIKTAILGLTWKSVDP